jgi:hypothetical protein
VGGERERWEERGESGFAWGRLRSGGTVFKKNFGFHGMIGTSGTKWIIFI